MDVSSFTGKTPEALLAIASNAALTIGENPVYNVPKSTITALTALDTALLNAMNAQKAAQLAEKASTTAKLQAKRQVALALTSIQAIVVQQPGVTTEMLDALGFSRRSTAKTQPKVPSAPTELSVVLQQDGSAKLRWKKGATTPTTTSYLIEQSFDGIDFTIVDSTNRVSYTVPQVDPGVACFFRVTAKTAMGRSVPSAKVGVYLPSIPARPALKLAA